MAAYCGFFEISMRLIDEDMAFRFFKFVKNNYTLLIGACLLRLIFKKIEKSLEKVAIVFAQAILHGIRRILLNDARKNLATASLADRKQIRDVPYFCKRLRF